MITGNLPFKPGQTYFQGNTVDTSIDAQLGWRGQEYWYRTGLAEDVLTKVRPVRNESGVTLLAGTPVQLSHDRKRIIGVAADYGGKWAIVDYGLNSSGCPANDYCYVGEEGPYKAKTPGTIASGEEWVAGSPLNAKTLASSTNSTSGGLVARTSAPTNATQAMSIIDGTLAKAISAATSAETNSLKSVFLDVKWS